MNHLNKEDIAKLVKEGRIAKGYTQQGLSDLAGISLRSVQRIENADVLPRLYTLKILSEKLNFSVEQITKEADIVSQVNTSFVLPKNQFNKPRKVILTVSSGMLVMLFTGAYLSQSAKFPETNFELFIFLIAVIGVYTVGLFKIWK